MKVLPGCIANTKGYRFVVIIFHITRQKFCEILRCTIVAPIMSLNGSIWKFCVMGFEGGRGGAGCFYRGAIK